MKEIIEILCLRVWELRCCKVTHGIFWSQNVLQSIQEVFGTIVLCLKFLS